MSISDGWMDGKVWLESKYLNIYEASQDTVYTLLPQRLKKYCTIVSLCRTIYNRLKNCNKHGFPMVKL